MQRHDVSEARRQGCCCWRSTREAGRNRIIRAVPVEGLAGRGTPAAPHADLALTPTLAAAAPPGVVPRVPAASGAAFSAGAAAGPAPGAVPPPALTAATVATAAAVAVGRAVPAAAGAVPAVLAAAPIPVALPVRGAAGSSGRLHGAACPRDGRASMGAPIQELPASAVGTHAGPASTASQHPQR